LRKQARSPRLTHARSRSDHADVSDDERFVRFALALLSRREILSPLLFPPPRLLSRVARLEQRISLCSAASSSDGRSRGVVKWLASRASPASLRPYAKGLLVPSPPRGHLRRKDPNDAPLFDVDRKMHVNGWDEAILWGLSPLAVHPYLRAVGRSFVFTLISRRVCACVDRHFSLRGAHAAESLLSHTSPLYTFRDAGELPRPLHSPVLLSLSLTGLKMRERALSGRPVFGKASRREKSILAYRPNFDSFAGRKKLTTNDRWEKRTNVV